MHSDHIEYFKDHIESKEEEVDGEVQVTLIPKLAETWEVENCLPFSPSFIFMIEFLLSMY